MPEPWEPQADGPSEAEKFRIASKLLGVRSDDEEADLQRQCRAAIADGELAYDALPLYQRGHPCAKCGGTEAVVKYVDPTEAPVGRLPVRYYRCCGLRPAMCVHCTACHYEWFERPLDSEKIGGGGGRSDDPREPHAAATPPAA